MRQCTEKSRPFSLYGGSLVHADFVKTHIDRKFATSDLVLGRYGPVEPLCLTDAEV